MKNFQARQGDIWFESKNPSGQLKKKTDNILAYGEVTGHAHKVMSPSMDELESVVDEQGDIFLFSKEKAITIGHDEHDQIVLPAGQWNCITRQREYDPLAAAKERQVKD
jgi:hypothetical protein